MVEDYATECNLSNRYYEQKKTLLAAQNIMENFAKT